MPPSNNPEQKVVLITGCSSGFGLVITGYLASRGYRVIATMRNLTKQTALRNELNRLGATSNVDIQQLDVTKPDSIKSVMDFITAMYGHIDVLINNAGYGLGGCFEDLADDEIRQQFETNFFGVQNVIRQSIPLMRQRTESTIITISSISGLIGIPCFGAYAASKWALEGFSESLYYELKPFGIRVALIEPGTYKTKIFYENARYARNFDNPKSPYHGISQQFRTRVFKNLLDNFKDPQDVAVLCEKIICAKHPRFRNIPDIESQCIALIKRVLPFCMFSWGVKKTVLAMYHQPTSTQTPRTPQPPLPQSTVTPPSIKPIAHTQRQPKEAHVR